MEKINWQRAAAERYHRFLPDEMRTYLKNRGIHPTAIERHLLGWNGAEITIPVLGPDREVRGFRYAKLGDDPNEPAAVRSDAAVVGELFGRETFAHNTRRVVITEEEFDRLVLEANRIPAVAMSGEFQKEWIRDFERVRHIYLCFATNASSAEKAASLARSLPHARILTLPKVLGPHAPITEFFVKLGMTKLDFEALLAQAEAGSENRDRDDTLPPGSIFRARDKRQRRRAARITNDVPLHRIAGYYTELEASGGRLVGHCPLCDDRERSFAVDPKENVYHCFNCGAHGDVVTLLMEKESMSYKEALAVLERFLSINELFAIA